ncbi:hypothetical protein K438DRAFT_1753258 [Mycena galopus ATCC 62051]|nr:hypothetical protein K438DRAFT_1753258 [Mycena galopus ATCC 62051]
MCGPSWRSRPILPFVEPFLHIDRKRLYTIRNEMERIGVSTPAEMNMVLLLEECELHLVVIQIRLAEYMDDTGGKGRHTQNARDGTTKATRAFVTPLFLGEDIKKNKNGTKALVAFVVPSPQMCVEFVLLLSVVGPADMPGAPQPTFEVLLCLPIIPASVTNNWHVSMDGGGSDAKMKRLWAHLDNVEDPNFLNMFAGHARVPTREGGLDPGAPPTFLRKSATARLSLAIATSCFRHDAADLPPDSPSPEIVINLIPLLYMCRRMPTVPHAARGK